MAMFSKRHYEAIAQVLNEARTRNRERQGEAWAGGVATLDHIERQLVALFSADNSAFDSLRFMRAAADFIPEGSIKVIAERASR